MTTSTRKPFTIAIVGGGITGVTLAISLCKRGIPCNIYEQAAAFGEIGAGVGLHPNAVRSLRIGDERMVAAFDKVATHNAWESKRDVWFDFFDGTADVPAAELKPLFTVGGLQKGGGHGGVHRARFLDELVKLVPDGIAHFDKRLDSVVDDREKSGKMILTLCDGTSAEADAVLGCDGIKSRTREVMVGKDSPQAKCRYSHKYAWRGLIPIEDAINALGPEKGQNTGLWMGPDHHVLTFPVNHGKTLNLVAFVTDPGEWPSDTNLTLPSSREEALEDFKGFGPSVLNLIKLTGENSDRWGLFDLAEHPLSTFYKGGICLVGDAAHASTPHHGAGAGLCLEDVAVMASLLGDERVQSAQDLEAVFAAFDANRRERDQWLVQSSRRAADIYEWRSTDIGKDFDLMRQDIIGRQGTLWNIDLDREILEAREDLGKRLSVGAT
ncbi:FAD/NAD(P)-binding domain-containing protein [Pleurostoma richardsiae]|uniref:FAD/NAD(P)-binding domain-containing protein n=1 Tax=Pleurostoma richardsiae TaxID=41990 RepID=A0AA38RBV2_9PEZI|nr:FAD/NAD(P)-binding domain-containing protein [Pleurostoma richardsiae]